MPDIGYNIFSYYEALIDCFDKIWYYFVYSSYNNVINYLLCVNFHSVRVLDGKDSYYTFKQTEN